MNKENNRQDVALFILKSLRQEGIEDIFLVPGFVIDPFLPAYSKAGVNAIVAAHEGGAAYMADGYGRASQNFGVCMGVGGPGITNMVTAVSAAYGDRTSILVIAGKIPPSWEGKGTFQDSSSSSGIDDIAIMRPMTTFAAVVPEVNLLAIFLKKAIRAMRGMENLPAFLCIPEDMHRESYQASYTTQPRGPQRILEIEALSRVPELLVNAEYITFLVGNGAVRSQASKEIQDFAEAYNIPVVTTMRAKGVVPEDSVMSFGVFGVGGSLQADKVVMGSVGNPLIPKTEVLIALGATLNENNTHFRSPEFPPRTALVRVDINPNDTRGMEYEEHFVMADVKTFLTWLIQNKDSYHERLKATVSARRDWTDKIRSTPFYDDEACRKSNKSPIHPARAIAELRNAAPRNSMVVVDSGAHTFFAGHHWTSYAANEFFFLSTMGPMGYGIAMGIGAKRARPEKPCISIVGDGSMLMHGMELHTAVRYKVPLMVVVLNNSALGNVYLRAREAGKEAAELAEIKPPRNWADFAKSLGAEGIRVEKPVELLSAYERAIRHISQTANTPCLVEIICDREAKAPNQ